MRKSPFSILAALLLFATALADRAQADAPPPNSTIAAPTTAEEDASSKKARAALDAMVQALGGNQWLNAQNSYVEGRIAGFFQGKPTGATVRYWDWRTPDAERIDLTEGKTDKHNWTQIFEAKNCWEVTFRGKLPIPKEQCAEAIRRRDHSIEVAVRTWMKDPTTVLMYEGQSLAERHLAQQVTLLNADNDSITIQIDAMSHLPLRRTYYWRDPLYKDKNEETEEYDDYHTIDGIQTPFTVTRLHNGDMTAQRFIFKASYNVTLPPDAFNADAEAARLHH
ncbi:MAG: hypothetical protein WBE63_17680 [Acidobacteriaceae bacterium]